MTVAMRRINPDNLTTQDRRRIFKPVAHIEAQRLAADCLRDALPNGSAPCGWYVLKVEQRREKAVADSLKDTGFEYWLPEERIVMPPKRKLPRRIIHRPYFRGYLFVKSRQSARGFVGLMHMRFVDGILGTSRGPEMVHEKIINGLRDLIAKWELPGRRPRVAIHELQAGDDVLIRRGPFADFRAKVEDGYVGTRRVRVIQNLFGGETIATYDVDDLRKL